MPYPELSTHFLVSFARCVAYAPPSVYIPPNDDLSDNDIDTLMDYFLHETPRETVLAEFGMVVGYTEAYEFLIDLGVDPMIKVVSNLAWRTVVNLLLKMMVTNGTLKWRRLNDPQFGLFSQFYLQAPAETATDNDETIDDTDDEEEETDDE